MDETYIRVKGEWVRLYRAVDATGQTIDFLLSPKRDASSARRFFRKALKQSHTVNPRTITVDKNAAYPVAANAVKQDAELWRFARIWTDLYFNEIGFRLLQGVVIGQAARRTRKGCQIVKILWVRVPPALQIPAVFRSAVGREMRRTKVGRIDLVSKGAVFG
ncbi:DDE-type integrase/transposase/recombinase [Microvirga sp. G4-2]|uniref:DDE-type integrase/transposase/recombinase n=1 Tax=Microvirga sp. G4-2 TaxID=3434467 RepID=UPI004043D507